MNLPINQKTVAWLTEKRIFFGAAGNARLANIAVLDWPDRTLVEPYVCFGSGNTVHSMGAFSYINSHVQAPLIVSIGRYCSIASGLNVPSPRHPIEFISTSTFTHRHNREPIISFHKDCGIENARTPPPFTQKGGVVIEHDVWIGANVNLMPGIHLETGCVVAAGSVVTKSVAPYMVVGGNPARVIRRRFDDKICEGLLNSQWWKYKYTDFNHLPFDKPDAFINEFSEVRDELVVFEPTKICSPRDLL